MVSLEVPLVMYSAEGVPYKIGGARLRVLYEIETTWVFGGYDDILPEKFDRSDYSITSTPAGPVEVGYIPLPAEKKDVASLNEHIHRLERKKNMPIEGIENLKDEGNPLGQRIDEQLGAKAIGPEVTVLKKRLEEISNEEDDGPVHVIPQKPPSEQVAETLQDQARRLVFLEARNNNLDKTDFHVDFTLDDVYVVWFCKTLRNWKALVSTTLPDGKYYEVTYNGQDVEIYIDTYVKVSNKKVAG